MLSLEGAIDLHVHAAPEVFGRIGDAVQIGKRCEAAGMRAVVFKAHHEGTMTRAYYANQQLQNLTTFNIGQPMAFHQGGGMLLQQAADLIHGAGVGQCVGATDAGQPYSPWPDEELRAFMNCLYDVGLTEKDIRRLMVDNPARLLGLT